MLTRREQLAKRLKRVRLCLGGAARHAATPVFVFGAQRSGTNMLARLLERHPRVECLHEYDDEAFRDYVLKDDAHIERLIGRSRASSIVFKCISDSQRARAILNRFPTARSIWIHRSCDDVVNSSLENFREHREYLRLVLEEPGRAGWRRENLSDQDLASISRHHGRGIDDASARALIWFLRNSLLFRQDLLRDGRTLVLRYEDLVRSPRRECELITRFLGLASSGRMAAGVHPRSVGKKAVRDIDPEIRALCDELADRLHAAGRDGRRLAA
ncbi:MAG: sulfotransferase [Chromatiales bacterium]|nr:sulfotransferase [Chromatiales bacterium]